MTCNSACINILMKLLQRFHVSNPTMRLGVFNAVRYFSCLRVQFVFREAFDL